MLTTSCPHRAVLTTLLCLSIAGCQSSDPAPSSAVDLWFANLSAGCINDSNGTGAVPESIVGLTAVLRTAEYGKTIHRTTRAQVKAAGFWELTGLPISPKVDVEVYGCNADKQVTYAGRSNGGAVEEQRETSISVFLAPVSQLACTGSADAKTSNGSGHLFQPRSMTTACALPSGHVLVSGGVGQWDGATSKGMGSLATALYDHASGFFRAGPTMQSARVLHHAHALGDRHVLVAGGATSIQQVSFSLLKGVLLAPDDVKSSHPKVAAEVLDLGAASDGVGATSKSATVDVGAGLQILSSSLHLGDALFFAGGIDDSGNASKAATRVSDLAAIAAGKKATTEAISMQVARVGPGLLETASGAVIIWGGADGDASSLAELLAKGANKTSLVKVVGADSLLKSPSLATMRPQVALLQEAGDKVVFLVSGGQPFSTPLAAVDAPSYVVELSSKGRTAKITLVSVDGGVLQAGLGAATTRLPTGQILIAGGLLSLTGASPCKPSDNECISAKVQLLDVPTAITGESVTITSSMSKISLTSARFGVTAAPLPLGALLVGGQSTAVTTTIKASDALDPSGYVVMGGLSIDLQAEVCGK